MLQLVPCDGASRSRWQLGLAAGSTADSCRCIFTLAQGISTGPSGRRRTCWRTAILTPDPCSYILSPAPSFGLPFAWMPPEAAGGTFYGISSAHRGQRLLLARMLDPALPNPAWRA